MEKNLHERSNIKRILITGPESSGKTELASELVLHYGGVYISEYARSFIKELGRPYGYDDVEHIARQQVLEYDRADLNKGLVFFDTWLIITRVWFDVVFSRMPGWMDEQIRQARFDLVLLCAPDLPWIPDPVRENGGNQRMVLFDRYKEELDMFNLNWKLVSGSGKQRFERAEHLVNNI